MRALIGLARVYHSLKSSVHIAFYCYLKALKPAMTVDVVQSRSQAVTRQRPPSRQHE